MTKIKLLKKNFEDKRGKIIDVFVNSPKDHCTIVTFTKGAVRGNHFHKKSTQFSFLLSGCSFMASRLIPLHDIKSPSGEYPGLIALFILFTVS